jgi:hypothetical protein
MPEREIRRPYLHALLVLLDLALVFPSCVSTFVQAIRYGVIRWRESLLVEPPTIPWQDLRAVEQGIWWAK